MWGERWGLDEAGALYEMAISSIERISPRQLDDKARDSLQVSLTNRGLALSTQGKFDEAEACFLRAVDLRESLQDTTWGLSVLYSNLGLNKKRQGQFIEALAYYGKARSLIVADLGDGHPEYAMNLHNRGSLQLELGNFSVAKSLLEQALELKQKTIGGSSRSTGLTKYRLAQAVFELGEIELSDSLLREALTIADSVQGRKSFMAARVLHGPGQNRLRAGDAKAASEFASEALIILREVGRTSDIEGVGVLLTLVGAHTSLGNLNVAQTSLNDATGLMRGQSWANLIQSELLFRQGELNQAAGDIVQAEIAFKESIELGVINLGDKNPRLVNPLRALTDLLTDQGRESEAAHWLNHWEWITAPEQTSRAGNSFRQPGSNG